MHSVSYVRLLKNIMRYVLVSNVKGVAGEFNEKLRRDVKDTFGVRASTLPAHFTIKAPFVYEGDLNPFIETLSTFAKSHKKTPYVIDGYDTFDDRVVYMDIKMSSKGQQLHDTLIDTLERFPFIHFKENEGKNKTFHVTVASKKIKPIFIDLYDYVRKFPCHFQVEFDNMVLYSWQETTWKLVKEWTFQ